MAIRLPNVSVPILDNFQVIHWHSLQCELVTPMYGGGVETATADTKMPIRASAIRGQLRFWWRLLAKHKWKLGNTKAIQNAEFTLWGGMGDDDGGRASQVFIKVLQPRFTHHDLMDWQGIRLPYVMFPASNETNPNISHQLLKIDRAQFQLNIAFSPLLQHDQDRINQVIEALQWWANFGGLGARTRRGLGAVHVAKCDNFPKVSQPLTADEVAEAGCKLRVRITRSVDVLQQLQKGIQKLSEFRQVANMGRNQGQQANRPGRSRWSEPDALRRLHRTHHSNHVPEHAAGNIFPRAMFGLPIIFKFVGAGEPKDSKLVPAQGDRLASPLIIRPYYTGTVNNDSRKEWSAAALVLPYEHIKNMQVTIGGRENYPVWKADAAQQIRPIHENNGKDPIDAFLNYFAN